MSLQGAGTSVRATIGVLDSKSWHHDRGMNLVWAPEPARHSQALGHRAEDLAKFVEWLPP
ncbi:hypothetical protein V5E97_35715 [Singulisphaera sp. Ch08]|uniref:Uncharacterized protein n=1 Tax=Singulisphaera sp. Ch08 TaxID=3120278 RepID=A0AAU7CEP7_9BACT